MVTYDPRLFEFAHSIAHIDDGSLTHEEVTYPEVNLMRSSGNRARKNGLLEYNLQK